MTVRKLLQTIKITDNAVFIKTDTQEELFSVLRNYGKITSDMIPENILAMEIDGICGASTKNKIAIWVK